MPELQPAPSFLVTARKQLLTVYCPSNRNLTVYRPRHDDIRLQERGNDEPTLEGLAPDGSPCNLISRIPSLHQTGESLAPMDEEYDFVMPSLEVITKKTANVANDTLL